MSSAIYDMTLVAGVPQRLSALGTHFKVLSAPSGALSIQDDNGERVVCLEGQGRQHRRFTQLYVTSAVAQAVQVFAGDNDFEDTRITGTVKVIDQGTDKSIAGSQFWQVVGQSATAGQGSLIYLIPGAGSKRVSIKGMAVNSGVAGAVTIGYGSGGGTLIGAGAPLNSKLINGGGGQARLGSGVSAGAFPTVGEVAGYAGVGGVYVPANQQTLVLLTTPLVLSGTNVLIVSAGALNRDIVVQFDIEES